MNWVWSLSSVLLHVSFCVRDHTPNIRTILCRWCCLVELIHVVKHILPLKILEVSVSAPNPVAV